MDETWVPMLVAAALIGFVAGLRAMMAPAIAAWAAYLGMLGTVWGWVSFMESPIAAGIFTALALGELVTDQLPSTPSRKVPIQFAARILMGALAGATIGAATKSLWGGLVVGAVGAIVGTLVGAWGRGALARAFGKDRPAALLEDALAILLGIGAVCLL
jgi:uncharacterized membrane protein